MKSYNKHKEIELPWLKLAPSHWKIARNKNILIEQKLTVGYNSVLYRLLSLTKSGVIVRDIENGKGKFPKDFNNYKVVTVDDIIFCLFDIDETPRTVGLSEYNGMITGAYDIFKVVDVNCKYLLYYYLSIDNIKALKPYYTGLRKVIRLDTFFGIKIPIPPKDEQKQIVRYLDWKVSLINKFIKEKKREVALLKELKNAEINHAVTRGLAPEVPLKDSGVEWIGSIPQHWEVKNFNQHFSFGKGLPITKEDLRNEGVEVISYGQIHSKFNNSIGLDASLIRYVCPSYLDTHIQSLLNYGDFVFADTSEDIEGAGNNIFINSMHPVFAGYHTLITRPKPLGCCEYLAYLFLSTKWKQQVQILVNGIKVFSINKSILKKTKLLFPPILERQQIVDYITEKEKKINKAISEIEREIELVKEYKTRLISDVVTGKVDVRGIVIPDFQSEPELIEPTDQEVDDQTEIN